MKLYYLCLIFLLFFSCQAQFPQDRAALIDFYNGLTDVSPLQWDLLAPTLCGQTGIICDANNNDRVVQIVLPFLGLEGKIPTSFGDLSNLIRLDLSLNNINGNIPTELGSLKLLLHLHLNGNDLSGQIPSQLSGSSNMETLLLASNQFTGSIPSSFQAFTHLSEIDLSSNSLTGTIPVQISKLGNLSKINLSQNSLTGSVSTFFASIPTLTELNLSRNQLSGRIPFEFGELTMSYLDLSHNLLTGFIPSNFATGTAFYDVLYFGYNNLDCAVGYFFGTFADDYAYLTNECTTYCEPNPCLFNERCQLGGVHYNITTCREVLPCVGIANPKFGLSPDFIFFYGDYFDSTTTLECNFGGLGSSPATQFGPTLGMCDIPACVSCAGKTVRLRIEGDGMFDPTCDTFFRFSSGMGVLDPHFSGFNGESMEATKDKAASNQLFHLYCSPLVTVTSLFYEYQDENLFMTKFWVRLGKTTFTLNLSTTPKLISKGHSQIEDLVSLGRKRIYIEGGHLEWDDNTLRVFYDYLQINFAYKIYLNENPYMNVEFYLRPKKVKESQVTGIIGRTLNKSLSKDQFKEYHQFKASVSDIIDFKCSIPLDLI